MTWEEDIPYLVDLEGRAPVRFYRADGSWLNNIDVTCVLRDLPLRQFCLHQARDLSLRFVFRAGPVSESTLTQRLRNLFGKGIDLEVVGAGGQELLENKWISYTSEVEA
jgi:hypothetical protein